MQAYQETNISRLHFDNLAGYVFEDWPANMALQCYKNNEFPFARLGSVNALMVLCEKDCIANPLQWRILCGYKKLKFTEFIGHVD